MKFNLVRLCAVCPILMMTTKHFYLAITCTRNESKYGYITVYHFLNQVRYLCLMPLCLQFSNDHVSVLSLAESGK